MYLSQLHYLTRPKVNISLLVLHVTHTVGSLAGVFSFIYFTFRHSSTWGGRPSYHGGTVSGDVEITGEYFCCQ